MGSTKPQLFAIQNEATPSPESGGDDPASGKHPTRPTDIADTAAEHGLDDGSPQEDDGAEGGVTDGEYRDGKPRWKIANLTEAEWRRALAYNNREIAEVTPGSPEFARLMEARHRMAFPPPAGIQYADISRYHDEQIRKELEAHVAAVPRPRSNAKWIALGLGFVALLVVAVVFVLPELGTPDATPTAQPTQAAAAPPTVAPQPAQPAPQVTVTATAAETAAASATATPSGPRSVPPQKTGATAVPPSTAKPVPTPAKSVDYTAPYFP